MLISGEQRRRGQENNLNWSLTRQMTGTVDDNLKGEGEAMNIWLGKDIPKQSNKRQIKNLKNGQKMVGRCPNHQKLFRRLWFFKAINDNSPRILHDIHLFQSLIKMHCSRFGILSVCSSR